MPYIYETHVQGDTQILKPTCNIWSNKVGSVLHRGLGGWIRITWSSFRTCVCWQLPEFVDKVGIGVLVITPSSNYSK